LSNTNESATVAKPKKFRELNVALLDSLAMQIFGLSKMVISIFLTKVNPISITHTTEMQNVDEDNLSNKRVEQRVYNDLLSFTVK